MRNEPDLSTLTTDALVKRARTTKSASIMLAVIIALQFAIGIYLTFKNGFNVFVVIPAAFLPLLMVNFSNLKKIKEEIARRN